MGMLIFREANWSAWMRAGLSGDSGAYRRLLDDMTPVLRVLARNGLRRAGASIADADDVMQETLLAIHLKRHTWSPGEPLGPWVAAIARYKLIDFLRRRGRRAEIPIDSIIEDLADAAPAQDDVSMDDVARLAAGLPGKQGDVVRAIAVSRRSIREAAEALRMTEGAVRVALHRGLKQLADLYRMENA
jgi:RNA polymerase sigma-70 factor (ECF subfamily)